MRIVDVGCGQGKLLRTLRIEHPELILSGCDINPLRNRDESDDFDFRLIPGPDAPLPYPDSFADVVLIVDVLEHVPNPPALLSEIRRILKPDGRMLGFIPAEGRRFSAYRFLRFIIADDVFIKTKDHIQAFSVLDA